MDRQTAPSTSSIGPMSRRSGRRLRPLCRASSPAGPATPSTDSFSPSCKSKSSVLRCEADRVTLVRRLYFDLIGLPPTPEQVAEFVHDHSPEAYEKLVDRLLASEHYGERMAMYWLDLVRYADSCGYHSDNDRDVYLYRDYVIEAFNSNEPFDRFTIEQLAGDLLPDANRRNADRLGLQPAIANDRRRGRRAEGIHGQICGRPGAQCVERLARLDDGLLRVPRSQVRSVQNARFLQHGGLLRRREGSPDFAARRNAVAHRGRSGAVEAPRRTSRGGPQDARHRRPPALDAAQSRLGKDGRETEDRLDAAASVSARAESGATLKVLDDDSVLASGKLPQQETYTLVADTDAAGSPASAGSDGRRELAGPRPGPREQRQLRLLRSHAESGAEKRSRAGIVNIPADKSSPTHATKIALEHASADLSQYGYRRRQCNRRQAGAPAGPILPEVGATHTAVFETRSPFGDAKGTRLTITLDFNYGDAHSIGRLRLSTTTHTPPLGDQARLAAETSPRSCESSPPSAVAAQRQTLVGPLPLDRAGIAQPRESSWPNWNGRKPS